jgi:beta-glucosidase
MVSRRGFLAGAASVLATGAFPAVSSAARPPGTATSPADGQYGIFPPGFRWGTATAAYQIEGAPLEEGRGPSIWDMFSHAAGNTFQGETGDAACEFYRRYPDDVKLLAELGVKHFRFSIAWPRVIPQGRGPVNHQGLDFYSRLTDTLLAHGITPHATLYHWDLPQVLQDRYSGWQDRQVTEDFGVYAGKVGKHLGDRIRDWMTLNEISSFALKGYGVGQPGKHAPGVSLTSEKERNQVVHHALLAHGTACLALRASCPQTPRVSIAENYGSYVPVVETEAHIEAARRAFLRGNGGILIPILTGRYDPGWMHDHRDSLPEIRPGDMGLIAQPLDALGFNCYTGTYVMASDNVRGFETPPVGSGYPTGNMPWLRIVPESLYWGVRMVGDAAGRKDLPLFISENGCADGGDADGSGFVADTDRIMYYRAYLGQLMRAIREGYPATGFFPWSFMDNFEWAWGYSKRFGLVRVDYRSQRRIPKLSFDWYREVIRKNRIL